MQQLTAYGSPLTAYYAKRALRLEPFIYFGPNNSNTSGSFSGGLVVEGSDSFLAFFAVFAWEGFDCSLFADPTTKLWGIGF
jgi:hypothetical protein